MNKIAIDRLYYASESGYRTIGKSDSIKDEQQDEIERYSGLLGQFSQGGLFKESISYSILKSTQGKRMCISRVTRDEGLRGRVETITLNVVIDREYLEKIDYNPFVLLRDTQIFPSNDRRPKERSLKTEVYDIKEQEGDWQAIDPLIKKCKHNSDLIATVLESGVSPIRTVIFDSEPDRRLLESILLCLPKPARLNFTFTSYAVEVSMRQFMCTIVPISAYNDMPGNVLEKLRVIDLTGEKGTVRSSGKYASMLAMSFQRNLNEGIEKARKYTNEAEKLGCWHDLKSLNQVASIIETESVYSKNKSPLLALEITNVISKITETDYGHLRTTSYLNDAISLVTQSHDSFSDETFIKCLELWVDLKEKWQDNKSISNIDMYDDILKFLKSRPEDRVYTSISKVLTFIKSIDINYYSSIVTDILKEVIQPMLNSIGLRGDRDIILHDVDELSLLIDDVSPVDEKLNLLRVLCHWLLEKKFNDKAGEITLKRIEIFGRNIKENGYQKDNEKQIVDVLSDLRKTMELLDERSRKSASVIKCMEDLCDSLFKTDSLAILHACCSVYEIINKSQKAKKCYEKLYFTCQDRTPRVVSTLGNFYIQEGRTNAQVMTVYSEWFKSGCQDKRVLHLFIRSVVLHLEPQSWIEEINCVIKNNPAVTGMLKSAIQEIWTHGKVNKLLVSFMVKIHCYFGIESTTDICQDAQTRGDIGQKDFLDFLREITNTHKNKLEKEKAQEQYEEERRRIEIDIQRRNTERKKVFVGTVVLLAIIGIVIGINKIQYTKWYNRGIEELTRKNWDGAILAFQRALEYSEGKKVREQLGVAYNEKCYEQYYSQAQFTEKKGDYEKAIKLYQKALVYKNTPNTKDRITYLQSNQKVKKQKAFANSIGMKFVLIKADEFLMGSLEDEGGRDNDEIQHRVTITQDFYIQTTEVTRKQFDRFVEATGYKTDAEKRGWSWNWNGKERTKDDGINWRIPGFEQDDNHPVVCVSWNDAQAFCQWLSIEEDKKYILPTEAEWEYVCRAGTDTAYQWGNNPDEGVGWCNGYDKKFWSSSGEGLYFKWIDDYKFTSPIRSFKPNKSGLYDMHGNVWEWCSDWYGEYPFEDVTDPTGPVNGKFKVVRGGSWFGKPDYLRSANRHWESPDFRSVNFGFRCVMSP